jgi:hypothetical protein
MQYTNRHKFELQLTIHTIYHAPMGGARNTLVPDETDERSQLATPV